MIKALVCGLHRSGTSAMAHLLAAGAGWSLLDDPEWAIEESPAHFLDDKPAFDVVQPAHRQAVGGERQRPQVDRRPGQVPGVLRVDDRIRAALFASRVTPAPNAARQRFDAALALDGASSASRAATIRMARRAGTSP